MLATRMAMSALQEPFVHYAEALSSTDLADIGFRVRECVAVLSAGSVRPSDPAPCGATM